MWSLQVIVGTIIFLWIYVLWRRRKYYKLIFQIPGPVGYPIIGMAHKLTNREDVLQVLADNLRIYGTVVFSWLGPYPFLVVSEPQIAQDIFTSPHCVDKGFIYHALDDGIGRGLFSLNNPHWSKHRKLINPAFGHKVLLNFVPIFNAETEALIKTLDGYVDKGEVDLTQVFQAFTLNIATKTTMGKDTTKGVSPVNEGIIKSYKCVLENMTEMCTCPWLRYRVMQWIYGKYAPYCKAKQEVHAFIRNLIYEKLNEETAEEPTVDVQKEKNVFIKVVMDLYKKGEFQWKNVEDESNVIVFGAFETTANTIGYTLMMLAMFPKYQQKLFEEIASLFPSRDNMDVTYADTQNMIYMDMVLNETMRIMAPVPLISRQTTQDIQLSNGLEIPEGTQIAIDIFHMHRRVDIWGSEAHIFNPDNFLPSNVEDKHSYAFIPFTKGVRNCIGWRYALISSKVILAKLLRSYSFTTSFNFQDLHFVEDITVKLKKTPLLALQRRT